MLADFCWNGTHQLSHFLDGRVFQLQVFLFFSGNIVIEPIFNGDLSAAEMILLVIVKAQAVFKIAATLPRHHSKSIDPAGPGPRLINTAPSIFEKNTSRIRASGFHHKNGKAVFYQRNWVTIEAQHIVDCVHLGIPAF